MPRYGSGGPVAAGSRPRVRGGRNWLLRLAIVVVILAALLEVADVVTRHVAEDTVAARAVKASGASGATAHVSGWPLLYDFFGDDSIPSVSVDLRDVPIKTSAATLTVEEVHVLLTDVGVSAGDLVGHRELRLTHISRADVRAVVTDAELSAAAGTKVEILSGSRVGVETPAGLQSATIQVTDDVLVVSEGGRELLRVDLTQDRLIPHCDMTTSTTPGRFTASCSVAPVPPSVLAALSARA